MRQSGSRSLNSPFSICGDCRESDSSRTTAFNQEQKIQLQRRANAARLRLVFQSCRFTWRSTLLIVEPRISDRLRTQSFAFLMSFMTLLNLELRSLRSSAYSDPYRVDEMKPSRIPELGRGRP